MFADAVNAGSGVVQPSDGDHASLHYDWDFGDPGSGTWTTSGLSRNTARGYVSAHVFENPGNYAVRLTVQNPATGQSWQYQQTVGVQGFSGTTYYVSSSGGSDSNDGRTTGTAFRSFEKGMSKVGATFRSCSSEAIAGR